jgi:broad specificity phosphatase PhoE
VIVLLVRHARAGDRDAWTDDDRLRPLDKKGRKQAEGLVELLADYPLERLISSPYLRCMQTFGSLAPARGLEVEEAGELAEGSTREDALRLLGSLKSENVAICTHGDVVVELIGEMMKKGAVEVLELGDGQVRRLRDLGRPRV